MLSKDYWYPFDESWPVKYTWPQGHDVQLVQDQVKVDSYKEIDFVWVMDAAESNVDEFMAVIVIECVGFLYSLMFK